MTDESSARLLIDKSSETTDCQVDQRLLMLRSDSDFAGDPGS